MAANTYTTSDLVTLIKTLGHVPQSNSTFTVANLLSLADLELRTAIAKQLKAANEGYSQTYIDYEQDASGQYSLPSDAVASTTFALQIKNGETLTPVSRQDVGEMTTTSSPSSAPYSFFMRGNTINVLPADFEGALRVIYERRQSKLVAVSACAQVASIASQVVTVTAVPSAWVNGDSIDMQQSVPHFDMLGAREITDITSLDITLDGDITDLSVGDYLCLSGQTCIPQVPVEFHQLLAQRVVCKIYELQGYLDKHQAAKRVLKEMEDDLTALITPRTQSAPKIINPSFGGRRSGGSMARFNPPAGA